MALLQAHPRLRVAVFILVGCLIGWLIVGSVVGIAISIVGNVLVPDSFDQRDVQAVVLGIPTVACLLAGGWVGYLRGRKPFRETAE